MPKKADEIKKTKVKKSTVVDSDQVLLTQSGYDKLKKELEFLKTEKRREVAERLKEAISYGDLSENSEYSEAKEEQAFVEGKIIELEKKIKNAKIVSEKHGSSVNLGSKVEIQFLNSKEKIKITIVGSTEGEPFENKFSNESPVGKALLGAKAGDEVTVKAPKGEQKYKVLKVS